MTSPYNIRGIWAAGLDRFSPKRAIWRWIALGIALLALFALTGDVSAALGDYINTVDFNLVSYSFSIPSANDDPEGITWDGSHLFIVDFTDTYVYAYTFSAQRVTIEESNLTNANGHPYGITWDGIYF